MARRRTTDARTLANLTELAVAAPQVVAIRTARMLTAGATPTRADRAEMSRMYAEKMQAFWESMIGMASAAAQANRQYAQAAAVQWWRLWTTPMQPGSTRNVMQAVATAALPTRAQRKRAVSNIVAAAVKPVHKRATANARRLAKKRRR